MPHDTIIRNFSTISPLAYSCPFAEGYAVYKARTLWSMFKPDSKYDDRFLCITIQNRGEIPVGNLEDYLNNLLVKPSDNLPPTTAQVSAEKAKRFEKSDQIVSVFPNPGNDKLTIQYACKTSGEWVLHNAIGQEVLWASLDKNVSNVKVNVEHLLPGIYTYKCTFTSCTPQFGKIIISR